MSSAVMLASSGQRANFRALPFATAVVKTASDPCRLIDGIGKDQRCFGDQPASLCRS